MGSADGSQGFTAAYDFATPATFDADTPTPAVLTGPTGSGVFADPLDILLAGGAGDLIVRAGSTLGPVATIAAVPEPTTVTAMLALGGVGLLTRRRSRRPAPDPVRLGAPRVG